MEEGTVPIQLRLTPLERLLGRLHLLPAPVMDAFGSVLFGRVLVIALRRGVFQATADAPCTVEDLAQKTDLSPKGIRLVAEALVSGGYLRRKGNAYSASAETRRWLLKESEYSIGNLLRYFETLYQRWDYLEYSLEHGSPPRPYYELFEEKDWELYVLAMRDLARLLAASVVPRIVLPDGTGLLLDVGGSHGVYSMECCRRSAGLTAVVMDFEGALRHADGLIRKAGMEQRIVLSPGDFLKKPFPKDVDVALMFNILHGFSEAENRRLFRKTLDALRPHGRLYVLDQMRSDSGGSPLARFIPLVVGLNLLNEIGGTSYTQEMVAGWCSGVSRIRRRRLRLPGLTMLEITA